MWPLVLIEDWQLVVERTGLQDLLQHHWIDLFAHDSLHLDNITYELLDAHVMLALSSPQDSLFFLSLELKAYQSSF